MTIRCSNPDCPSRTGKEEPFFLILVSVDADLATPIPICKRGAKDFKCLYCQAQAEEDKNDERRAD